MHRQILSNPNPYWAKRSLMQRWLGEMCHRLCVCDYQQLCRESPLTSFPGKPGFPGNPSKPAWPWKGNRGSRKPVWSLFLTVRFNKTVSTAVLIDAPPQAIVKTFIFLLPYLYFFIYSRTENVNENRRMMVHLDKVYIIIYTIYIHVDAVLKWSDL